MSANPDFLILRRYEGSVNWTTIILTSINNFNGNIALRVEKGFGIFGDVKPRLTFHNVYLPGGGETQVLLTLYVQSSITPGNYYVDIIGSSGKIKHSVRILINAPQ